MSLFSKSCLKLSLEILKIHYILGRSSKGSYRHHGSLALPQMVDR